MAHRPLERAEGVMSSLSTKDHQDHGMAQPSHSLSIKRGTRYEGQPRLAPPNVSSASSQPGFNRNETASSNKEGGLKGLSRMNEKSSCPVLRGRDGGNAILLLDGKTQIAIEYAYRHHHDYQAVLWAHAQTRDTLISSYVTIAELLFLPEQAAQDQAITIQAVKNWLQRERDWLLILDNADDLAMVRDFVPPAISYLVFATLVPKCYNPSNQTTLMRGAFYGK